MTLEPSAPPDLVVDPVEVLGRVPVTEELTEQERGYVAAARARSTLTGYRADWREFTAWCADEGHHQSVLPASPAAISQYLTYLAAQGAKVGTMSRRLSAIR